MGIKAAMIGTGAFAQSFIPLFNVHPLVDELILCDLDADKLRNNVEKHNVPATASSLDEICGRRDIDAAIIITQNWLHAPQAIQALKSGKHVYSAVPTGITLDEISELVRTVEDTGRIYMIGETSYYYPGVIYCRNQYNQGAFGHVVYGEAEYYHDWDHGLYEVAKWRGGKRWREFAGKPPMYYPTHSTSQIVSVTGARMTHVSCQGYVDQADDGIYVADANPWQNEYSNETALFKMSDGSMCRINEFRRIGHPGTVRMALFGTEGSFEHNTAGARWVAKHRDDMIDLDDALACQGVSIKRKSGEAMDVVTASDGTHLGASSVHPVERLPKEFIGLSNGHAGAHQFLVDDFVNACVSGKTPSNNVWEASRYAIPGIIAHDSSMRNGELLEIPDLGDPR